MEPKLPISVCLISGAEAHRIGQSLRSVADWTSEIVVVLNDNVSDGTEKVAESFGAKVFREPWRGFIKQKNSVSEKATQPWILGLDADEVVSNELRAEIIATVKSARCAAYEFPRCTFFFDRWIRHGDYYPDRVTRLWRKDCAHWAGIEPHAHLEVRGEIGRLKSDLLHYSNESIDRQIAKIAPYSDDFVRDYLEKNKHVSTIDLVGRPFWRFVRAYILKLGFLDGRPGLYIASLTAFSTLTRYMKVLEAQQKSRK
ncbi:MAG: wcaA [Verrucomicrobiales bacterium]|nr:wcaA [Verrucomicrobiales bacterium]